MQTNSRPNRGDHFTYEGGQGRKGSYYEQLRRAVMSCMLWEQSFYEDGIDIAERIKHLAARVHDVDVAALAIEARIAMNIRHAPLLLARELARNGARGSIVSNTLENVINRPDELAEFLALYWADGRVPLAKGVKRGLAAAFTKFDEYQLAKYNRKDRAIKLRDVMFLVHPKPKDDAQAQAFRKLANGVLEPPDTWEVALSGGADPKETFERLLREHKLGALALLRNLRKMVEVGVDDRLIEAALSEIDLAKVLPFRFLAAARQAPQFEDQLDSLMLLSARMLPRLPGRTIMLVDNSGSMMNQLSSRSDMTRSDAACALAAIVRELCDHVYIGSFTTRVSPVPPRRGMALIDAIRSQETGGTRVGKAVEEVSPLAHDRIIVVTDEQSADRVPPPVGRGYMINVAPHKVGVSGGDWNRVQGWSEAVPRYITMLEEAVNNG